MSELFDKYFKLFSGPINEYKIEDQIVNGFVEHIHGVDRTTILNYFSEALRMHVNYLAPKMATDLEYYNMKTEILHWVDEIESKLLHRKSPEIRLDYLESWIHRTKLEHNGQGWLRTNYAGCCKDCYAIHRIYLEFDEALQKKLLPYEHCTNVAGCTCRYVWKSKSEPIAKHPLFLNE